MSEQSVDVVKGAYAAFAEGDVPAVLGTFAEDIEWHEAEGMPYGGVHLGGEAVVQNVFGPLSQDVEAFAVTPEEFMEAGDTVAVVVRYTGTGKVSGKPLDLPVVHIWDIRDGKIVRFRQFVDTVRFADVVPASDSVVG
ncbi:MAG: nuclear transport factor 2 family protein [Actinobacteria bacterium]|nr:nuclear transport factor 2 family protein [Actinomycetota bacterium]